MKYRKSEPRLSIAGLPGKAYDVTEKRNQGLYTVTERIPAQHVLVLSFLLFPFFDSCLLSLFPFEQLQGISLREAMPASQSVTYTDTIFFVVNSVFSLYFLNYESIITHLQEAWKIQNRVAYSSTIEYNYLFK